MSSLPSAFGKIGLTASLVFLSIKILQNGFELVCKSSSD